MNFSRLFALLTLTGGILILTGCRQTVHMQQEPVYRSGIVTACIAGYFQKDDAPYITQQQHLFAPKAHYLKITASEPTGDYVFTLSKGNFKSTKQKTPFLSGLPASFMNEQLATALFYSFTAGAGLLDTAQFTTADNVKIEGQWYQPLIPPSFNGNTAVCLLRNINTKRIELAQLSQAQMIDSDPTPEAIACTIVGQKKWLLRSYNLRYNSELGVLVPMKIDVFDIQKGLASKRLIIQFEYTSVTEMGK